MSERRRSRPEDCEFTKETKLSALRRANWKCEQCGIDKQHAPEHYLEIHHKLGIALALRHHPEISHALISSLANAEVLCIKCHDKKDITDRKKHMQYAQELLSMQVRQLQLNLAYG